MKDAWAGPTRSAFVLLVAVEHASTSQVGGERTHGRGQSVAVLVIPKPLVRLFVCRLAKRLFGDLIPHAAMSETLSNR